MNKNPSVADMLSHEKYTELNKEKKWEGITKDNGAGYDHTFKGTGIPSIEVNKKLDTSDINIIRYLVHQNYEKNKTQNSERRKAIMEETTRYVDFTLEDCRKDGLIDPRKLKKRLQEMQNVMEMQERKLKLNKIKSMNAVQRVKSKIQDRVVCCISAPFTSGDIDLSKAVPMIEVPESELKKAIPYSIVFEDEAPEIIAELEEEMRIRRGVS